MQALAILFGALFTVASAIGLGGCVLGKDCEEVSVRFVCGSALLSLAVFLLCSLGLAYPTAFLLAGAGACGAGLRVRPLQVRRPGLTYFFLAIFAVYFVLYFFNAMAPESSPDGAAYHLGLVSRYLRDHGFHRNADSIYAMMPGGIEMLFLFAFAFGKHSAAAMVHFAFLLALVRQVFRHGLDIGKFSTATCAATLVFASPLVGVDATSAYNDVALAAVGFTLFRLLLMWEARPSPRLVVAIGLVAGFAVATKYTGWLAIPYALVWVGRKHWRNVLPAGMAAASVLGPWLLRNWIWYRNPLAPFFNQMFPNPWVMVGFEKIYRRMLATYELPSLWQLPMQVTTYGKLAGLLGPVFLLAPIALLALRSRAGRPLLLGALVFGANYFSNIGARFLIPSLPFVALAMALIFSQIPYLALAVAVIHAWISWPSHVVKYCAPEAWHLSKVIWKEALRIRPEEPYLESHLLYYGVDRMIERSAAPGSTVFTFKPIPEAYTSRRILVEYQSAENKISGAILWTAFEPEYAPTWRLRFRFPRQPLSAILVVQTGTGESQWSIHELRIRDGAAELPRASRWRLTAHPYPWGIQEAFDNSLATFWMCGSMLEPGQFASVRFGKLETADGVDIETAPNQLELKLRLEGQGAEGQWKTLAAAPEVGDAPRPLGLRRAVAEELKRRGIDYVLVFDSDVGADDMRENTDLYGIRPVGEYKGARLYQLP